MIVCVALVAGGHRGFWQGLARRPAVRCGERGQTSLVVERNREHVKDCRLVLSQHALQLDPRCIPLGVFWEDSLCVGFVSSRQV